jgi:regulator of protease activity HflC (stomatin/prohibitin superfamily)
MREACQPLGIEIVQALITRIRPPQKIADPVRKREIAKQQELQFQQQTLQQESEQKLAIEKALVLQKQALVKADQDVVKVTTQAMQDQEVAITKANENAAVSQLKLDASVDEAAAVEAKGKAAADVIRFDNAAEAAGWKKTVDAFSGDGQSYAQYVLYQKLAPSYRRIMVNTADSPIMKIFESFAESAADAKTRQGSVSASTKPDDASSKPVDTPKEQNLVSEAAAENKTPDVNAADSPSPDSPSPDSPSPDSPLPDSPSSDSPSSDSPSPDSPSPDSPSPDSPSPDSPSPE